MAGGKTDEIKDYLESIFDAAHLDLEATVDSVDYDYRVQLQGRDAGALLARDAELMNAFEYIANRAFGRTLDKDTRIIFDFNNYRGQREAELRLMAKKAAEKVKHSRSPFVFEPMGPNERRVIHLALAEDKSVKTESLGDRDDRKVIVRPA
ncbi:MAG TPA: R3H domain-containing nucleic acid-binding protein [Blastocatellia bacterium]|nr:R3H domain-containing nucleic acid-binding protein [Blastocatellia bacterium]